MTDLQEVFTYTVEDATPSYPTLTQVSETELAAELMRTVAEHFEDGLATAITGRSPLDASSYSSLKASALMKERARQDMALREKFLTGKLKGTDVQDDMERRRNKSNAEKLFNAADFFIRLYARSLAIKNDATAKDFSFTHMKELDFLIIPTDSRLALMAARAGKLAQLWGYKPAKTEKASMDFFNSCVDVQRGTLIITNKSNRTETAKFAGTPANSNQSASTQLVL